jgi:alginate O-acetyltransferase complex protein AlgJ
MNRALVFSFILIIALPLGTNLAGIDGADPSAERRELSQFPSRPDSWKSVSTYPDALGRWFDDHFGFRNLLVRWYAESRLFVLGVSPSNAVMKGRDGWLFYAEDGALDDYTNQKPLTPLEVKLWREAIARARDWLRNRHVGYVFVLAPDKHVIYPEKVTSALRQLGPTSRMDQVYAALDGTGVATVDLRPGLLAAKRAERLYFLTDTHWNDRGAFIAYQQIVDAVRQQVPAMPPAWRREDFLPIEAEVEGRDLARLVGLTGLPEVDLQLQPKRQRRARIVEPMGAEPRAQVGRLVTEIDDSRLPRAVIFRDSFTAGLVPFLSEHFSRAVYLWQNDFDPDEVLVERPDIVIQEIVGRHLYTFLASPELVPQ